MQMAQDMSQKVLVLAAPGSIRLLLIILFGGWYIVISEDEADDFQAT